MKHQVEFSSDAVAEHAKQPHALNVSISEYDWQRLKEVALVDGMGSVSEVARYALSVYLDEVPHSEHIADVARAAVEFEFKIAEMRANLRTTIDQS